ncbi:peptidoglycan DD-metalloendopeptidase family protein [Bizionia gelidisalsuginis]|uniref:Peptidoglycan DD-metalloendopeptidase family protein n=1 Tax=Bizionia gelidisalsuginis TaxID=291188 RepID=A0ABY3MDH3_9FLAO|nr:peptidoglycan DD-metalloendopeptidase family protein [Bizionia gelidisalsuginis]TYC17025.1 peptidoglycan DD-metalloendopeptidase family protein [Bizionia gelidisalsuginis]
MTSTTFSIFLAEIAHNPIVVIDASIDISQYMPIDLSEANDDLKQFDMSSAIAWHDYITSTLGFHNKQVAYGGYLEQRGMYSRSAYFNTRHPETERNIHLGIDLWIAAGTPVLAAFNGEIHSFKDNTNYGDYGPTIILKHTIKTVTFYTLYGHLSRGSLPSLKVGDIIRQGEMIAILGDAKVNGEYAPHLHFQVIRDLQGNSGDYPGVTCIKDLEFYKNNCPDPNIILGLGK